VGWSRMETLAEPKLATARSILPSPLKSPAATEPGKVPTPVKVNCDGNVPSPLPNSTLTLPPFVTTKSRAPPPLTSATATDPGEPTG